jgi:RNA polymerase sigma-70 factor (ECF subfamily)
VEDQIRAAQRGDPLAMSGLMTDLAPWVGRICGAIALDQGDDAMQETLIAVFRNLPTLREPAALRAWVRRIAVRESLRLVTGRREVASGELLEQSSPPPDSATALDVREVLVSLSPAQRAVLVLRHVEDLSEEQTAQILGVDQGTVKSRGHRARLAFTRRWAS